jgi:hypothetical protein
VRRTFAMLGLVAGLASPAVGQRAWQTEIGIQGGFSRIVVPGQGGPTDIVSLPGFSLGAALPAPSALYVILPWKEKIAVEFDVAGSQIAGPIAATLFQLGLRADYALTSQFYGAAGVGVGYVNSGSAGLTETQLAIQGGVGYRRRLSRVLNARVEGRVTFWGKAENIAPRSAYSVLLGVSTVTGGRGVAAPRREPAGRAWTPQLGLAGGYVNFHGVGSPTDITVLAFPALGSGLGALGFAAGGPATMFAIIPVGTKMALEPGLDLGRFQEGGSTDFVGNFSTRLNYALSGGWYAAAGGTLTYIKTTGTDAASITGLQTAVGYRFAVSGPVSGRVELNYTMSGKNTDIGIPPINVMGLMLGAMVPLK